MMDSQATLSRAILRIGRGGGDAERRSTAPYLIHQAIADLFGDREDRGYLYRLTDEWPGGAEVLVLSKYEPQALAALQSPPHRRVERIESKRFAPALVAGQRLDFEVRINATTVVTEFNAGNGAVPRKRRMDAWDAVWRRDRHNPAINPHRVYGEYLARKLEGTAKLIPGESGDLARVVERGEVCARRGDRRAAIRFVATNLLGSLQVLDPEHLVKHLVAGVGRAKAFGCGLICISRPGTVLPRRHAALESSEV